MLNRVIAPVVRKVASPSKWGVTSIRQGSHHSTPVTTTMNELPVPSGSWETHYRAQQTKYNMHLAVGVVFTAVTIVVAKASGLVFLNYSPPDYPKED